MIYTDGIHMVSTDSLDDLHAFAARIGLPPRWFHPAPRHPHYDLLTDDALAKALAAGARRVRPRDIIHVIRTNPALAPAGAGKAATAPPGREGRRGCVRD
ncbi:MAG: DUF4031 domain-containing protein [Alicyclobacillus mali]|uniref:DUF4031 domain-containing protein n=1 Tax=Alicyclobacillus mali (ex Roth et al. 2021) TaxID=1123961 RepID=UPI0023F523D8|nr:DUF4031 domain-containing protein [Alicyclobacillus mali (ex Roth et al. 2021)]MCL6487370.1 DUF4031 domain-containing protein [Alicyclobacillus mali (ex Roth et al. 2021)]